MKSMLDRDHIFVGHYSASPDDDVFKTLSKDYADRHLTMQKPDVCIGGFKDGITNGAEWYELTGILLNILSDYHLRVNEHSFFFLSIGIFQHRGNAGL